MPIDRDWREPWADGPEEDAGTDRELQDIATVSADVYDEIVDLLFGDNGAVLAEFLKELSAPDADVDAFVHIMMSKPRAYFQPLLTKLAQQCNNMAELWYDNKPTGTEFARVIAAFVAAAGDKLDVSVRSLVTALRTHGSDYCDGIVDAMDISVKRPSDPGYGDDGDY